MAYNYEIIETYILRIALKFAKDFAGFNVILYNSQGFFLIGKQPNYLIHNITYKIFNF